MLSDATKHSFELAKTLAVLSYFSDEDMLWIRTIAAEASKNHSLAEMQIWKHSPSSSTASVQVFLAAMFLAAFLFNFSSSFL